MYWVGNIAIYNLEWMWFDSTASYKGIPLVRILVIFILIWLKIHLLLSRASLLLMISCLWVSIYVFPILLCVTIWFGRCLWERLLDTFIAIRALYLWKISFIDDYWWFLICRQFMDFKYFLAWPFDLGYTCRIGCWTLWSR